MAGNRKTFTEAARYLGVSLPKLRALVKERKITVEKDPLDERKKLIKTAELRKLKEARP
ncbi:MAG TPA: excisionase family DNA-binding protein [Blastocatellia bacterium]|nr:excisionase family DNA-binding protein [Blastocatellia bacterium]